ncbi:hypothetical protein PRIPAC_73218 [Pristionchus pacificus]|uniref:Uncharacterized protein n=1 Tax=Pristionchus pacificus TaxID=54126 RepID=A0A2A6C1M7_PRIPA|nr:hypothetical protein PRIPAC_73218 [Pristionchus pacificus]|eukprot:PDM72074.1 hypothetical protein PRIPAC_38481 [Pristionchus pacificus]
MIQVGDTRRVAQADGRGFSKLEMEESGGESRPPVVSARMENGEWRMERMEIGGPQGSTFFTLWRKKKRTLGARSAWRCYKTDSQTTTRKRMTVRINKPYSPRLNSYTSTVHPLLAKKHACSAPTRPAPAIITLGIWK